MIGPSWGTSDKIKIDPNTRLYVSREDGRVRVLHGLAIEAQGTPPYNLVTYTDEQIELFKTVSKKSSDNDCCMNSIQIV